MDYLKQEQEIGMMDLVQLEIKEKEKVFGQDFSYIKYQMDLLKFVKEEQKKEKKIQI